MGEGKHRLLGRWHPAALKKRGFGSSRAPVHLKGTIYTWTEDGDRLRWGPNALEALSLGSLPLPPTGKAFAALTEPGMGLGRIDAIAADAVVNHPRGMPYQLRYALRLDNSTIAWAEDRGRWFADRHGHPVMAHGMLTLIGKVEPKLLPVQTKARSDFLTAVAHHAGARARRNVSVLAFAVTFPRDGDEAGEIFSGVHDHPHGHDILEAVMARTRTMMRRHDQMMVKPDGSVVVALMGCPASQLAEAALHLRAQLTAAPLQIPGGPVTIALRIGAASAPDHAGSPLHLLCHAEEALHGSRPDVPFSVFDGCDRAPAALEKSLTTLLDDAEMLSEASLDAHLVLTRRPLVDSTSRLATLHLAGPGRRGADHQVVPAEDLRFAAASSTDLAVRLDRHLLALTCEELAFNSAGFSLLPISAASVTCNEWPVVLAAELGAHPDIASRLIIGIAENVVAANPALAERRMAGMKALGAGVAIVDFGGGFLPLSHLDSLPVDLVAIDGALVQNIAATADNRFHLRSAIESIGNRDIAVAALCVEDERTAALLGEWGVDYLEGRVRTAEPVSLPARRIA